MKVEYLFDSRPRTDTLPAVSRTVPVYYYGTGERVSPGRYACTFCGTVTDFVNGTTLPTCPVCDNTEFSAEKAA